MTCEHARALFSDLADGRLGAPERAACKGHLAECAECRGEWQGFQRMLGLLRTLPRLRAPAGFAERVLAAAGPAPWPRRMLRRLFVPLPVKLPLEAAALILIVGAVYLVQRTPEMQRAVQLQAPAPAPEETLARSEQPSAPRAAAREMRAARAPASPPPPPAPSTARDDAAAKRREQTLDAKAYAPAEGKPAPRAAEAPPAAARTTEPAPGVLGQPALRHRATSSEAEAKAGVEKFLAVAPPTLSGRLAVADPAGAERKLAELMGTLGATELGRRRVGDATVIELELPRSAWPEFSRALATLGAWTPEGVVPTGGPDRMRVVVRLSR